MTSAITTAKKMPSATVARLFAASASTIVDDEGTIEAAALVAEGAQWAAQWRDAGLQPGDRVALWQANSRTYLRALLACSVGGYVAVSVNTRWSDQEATRLMERSGAAALIADREGTSGLTPVVAFDPAAVAVAEAAWADAESPFVIFTTSGTTGEPKMVLHRQRSIAVHGPEAADALGYKPDQQVLVAMPLCGVFGLSSFTAAVAGGATIHLPSKIDPVDMAALVEREQIWSVNASDDFYHRVLDTEHDLSTIGLGGFARFNTSLDGIVERAEQRGVRLVGLYGMSEVQALFSARQSALPIAERQMPGGTVVSPDGGARVVDGELQVRGPSMFAGYLHEGGASIDEAKTALAFTDDGWFRTGDAAVEQDPIGDSDTFVFTARMGDVLRIGGFLVSPSEIERVILGLDGIVEAQVVAVDRPTGARPVAFITGSNPPEESAVIAHCRNELATFKCPVRVVHLERMPITPSANGTKIQKVTLREQGAALLDAERYTT